MPETKIHLCETCGGRLQIDTERQLYLCPFCGVTYDYAYFKEDDILQKASMFMKNHEFDAAKDAYEFALSKDPHNKAALRGMMLLTYGIGDIKKMRDTNLLENFRGDPKATDWIVEQAGEESKEYFQKLHKVFEEAQKYANVQKKVKELDAEIRTNERFIDSADSAISKNYYEYTNDDTGMSEADHPLKRLRTTALATGIMALMITFGAGGSSSNTGSPAHKGSGTFIALIWILAAIIIGIFFFADVLPRLQDMNRLEKHKAELASNLEAINGRRKALEAEKTEYSKVINNLIRQIKEEEEA